MKLYFSKGACSLVCRIIINEIGLPCVFIPVDLVNKKTQSGENYNAINLKGSVPAIETEHGEVLTENAVILQYLADISKSYQLLPQLGDFKRYRILEWLNYIATDLHKGFSPLFNQKLPQEIKDEIFIPILKSKFNFLNAHLEKSNYLGGDEFSLPDAYLFVMLTWANHFKFNLQEWPALSEYFNELKNRKSIQQSLKEEGLG